MRAQDMLEIGNTDHGHTLTSRVSISTCSPLILGNDPRNMTDEIKALLTNRELISTLSQVRSLRRSHRAVL